MFIKHTGTGHALAPGYLPLTAPEMGTLVAAMEGVYLAEASGRVAAARLDHR